MCMSPTCLCTVHCARTFTLSAYLSELIVWSAEEAAGETVVIMTVRAEVRVKDS